MGVPMRSYCCQELPIPRFIIHFLIFLSYIQNAVNWILRAVGLGTVLGDNVYGPVPSSVLVSAHQSPLPCRGCASRRLSTPTMIRQALPSSTYKPPSSKGEREDSDIPDTESDRCAVCLHELEAGEEVRRMGGCRHVFHACCIDSWVDIGRRTCPLCRAPVVPDEMLREAMIAAGKIVSGEGATDSCRFCPPLYVANYYNDGLYYGDDGDYYPALEDEFDDLQDADFLSWTVLPAVINVESSPSNVVSS